MNSKNIRSASIIVALGVASFNICAVEIIGSGTQVSREYILSQKEVPVYTFKVVNKYPHGEDNYTEGLVQEGDFLYEGTGRYGKSALLKKNFVTGEVLKEVKLDNLHFGEGITIIGDKIYQITYTSNEGFIYDKNSLDLIGTFNYSSQGWGMTTINKELVMSDGSSVVKFVNPNDFKITKIIRVKDSRSSIGWLNALEYVDGSLYANVWNTNIIAVINPDTGRVKSWIDLSSINPDPAVYKTPYVLNGITYNKKTHNLVVTGKSWPELYEIELVKL